MLSSTVSLHTCTHITAELVELWVQSWKATRSDIDFDARRDWFVQHMNGLHEAGATTILACDGAVMLGFVTINPHTNYMDQLAMRPDAFGSGVADQLVATAKYRSPYRIDLLVNQDNPRAIRFYRRAGFNITGEGGTKFKVWSMTWTPQHDKVG
jgi:putative acetyltransferase